MRIRIIYPLGKEPVEFQSLQQDYKKKMSRALSLSLEPIKTKSLGRDDSTQKKKHESESLLKSVESDEFVILLDEKGKKPGASIEFAEGLRRLIEQNRSKITFVIGGPYGVEASVRRRANLIWQLSELTMNHHLAKIVLLEQIYRAVTIWENKPYHNP